MLNDVGNITTDSSNFLFLEKLIQMVNEKDYQIRLINEDLSIKLNENSQILCDLKHSKEECIFLEREFLLQKLKYEEYTKELETEKENFIKEITNLRWEINELTNKEKNLDEQINSLLVKCSRYKEDKKFLKIKEKDLNKTIKELNNEIYSLTQENKLLNKKQNYLQDNEKNLASELYKIKNKNLKSSNYHTNTINFRNDEIYKTTKLATKFTFNPDSERNNSTKSNDSKIKILDNIENQKSNTKSHIPNRVCRSNSSENKVNENENKIYKKIKVCKTAKKTNDESKSLKELDLNTYHTFEDRYGNFDITEITNRKISKIDDFYSKDEDLFEGSEINHTINDDLKRYLIKIPETTKRYDYTNHETITSEQLSASNLLSVVNKLNSFKREPKELINTTYCSTIISQSEIKRLTNLIKFKVKNIDSFSILNTYTDQAFFDRLVDYCKHNSNKSEFFVLLNKNRAYRKALELNIEFHQFGMFILNEIEEITKQIGIKSNNKSTVNFIKSNNSKKTFDNASYYTQKFI